MKIEIIAYNEQKHLLDLVKIYIRAYSNFDSNEKWDEKTATAYLKWNHQLRPDLSLVATDKDGMVIGGFFSNVKPWWDGVILYEGELFVDPDYQNKGLGKQLIKKMITNAKQKYHIIRWENITFLQEQQQSFYKKLGFEKIDDWAIMSGEVERVLERLKDY